jgi:hypothetical protein
MAPGRSFHCFSSQTSSILTVPPETHAPDDRVSLTSTLFEALVSRLIYYPTAYPSLPRLIATVHDRDSQRLGKVLASARAALAAELLDTLRASFHGGRFGGQFLAASKALCSAAVSASCSTCGVFAAALLRTTQTSAADAQCHIALENAAKTGFLKRSDGACSGYIMLSARAVCAFL